MELMFYNQHPFIKQAGLFNNTVIGVGNKFLTWGKGLEEWGLKQFNLNSFLAKKVNDFSTSIQREGNRLIHPDYFKGLTSRAWQTIKNNPVAASAAVASGVGGWLIGDMQRNAQMPQPLYYPQNIYY